MEVEYCQKDSFSVIGKEGSTYDGEGFIQKLWKDAKEHFGEVASLAKKDKQGNYVGIWGVMTDFSRSFLPWQDNFAKGYYLAGIEVPDDAEAPEGWTKWTMPATEYLYVKDSSMNTFSDTIQYMKEHQLQLVGAVYDYNSPKEQGQAYLYFPIKRL